MLPPGVRRLSTTSSLKALDELGDAAAHATLVYAQTTSAVNGTDKGKGKGTYDTIRIGSHTAK